MIYKGTIMKKSAIHLILVLIFLICLSSCSIQPKHQKEIINESYHLQTEVPVIFEACYPIFEDIQYQSMNLAIESEISEWYTLYESICVSAAEECSQDIDFAKLERYVRAEYSIKATSKELSVTFIIQSFEGGNAESSYKKIYTLDLGNNIIYETFTQTKRIYT